MPLPIRTAGSKRGAAPPAFPRPSRRGFTLLELVLAAALGAILLVGMQSAVMIAAKAIPAQTQGSDASTQSAALDHMAMDLSYAKIITTQTARRLTFSVADRTGDGSDDAITFLWGGTAGDPLTRQINAGATETILADVAALSFSLQTEVIDAGKTYVDSSETLLASNATVASSANYQIQTTNWASQYTPVTLPNGAVDYRTTRVRLRLSTSGSSTGTNSMEIRTLRQRQPTTRVLASATLLESSIPGGTTWVNLTMPSVRNIEPNEPIGVLIRCTANSPSCDLTYQSSGAAAGTGAMFVTSDSGGTWTTTAGRSVFYEVWGVYRTEGTSTLTRAKYVLVSVRTGSTSKLELSLPLPNRPEVAP